MRQRAEEVGGRFTLGSGPSGTACDRGLPVVGREVRVLVVDDHPLFLDGVRAALVGADDLEVVGEAHDVPGRGRRAASCSPTSCSWTSAARRVGHRRHARDPRRAPGVRVLVMTMSDEDDAVVPRCGRVRGATS